MSKHTTTPWKVILCHTGYEVIDRDNRSVFNRSNPHEQEANAQFIVRACNNFDALLEVCKKALRDAEMDYHIVAVKKLKEAITKAEEVER